jgi:hypothetical protein
MQRVVNGKRYDTETAEKVCEWSKRDGLDWYKNALYRTARGAWFIAGEGGPMSQWREYIGMHWAGGEGLNPVDRDRARVLLEVHGTPEQCATYFAVEDA